ncbi:DUF2470 domain-containing protein [Streptomyces armeniacus]|uniref:DUF2470 domain-containing protein n=1 Tax=Streptomyces armeniacus TaxID=83291 RepID=A0A345XL65_9ACTN|nr:DUF2470 domain-containing protein [Streptomyces armeniacus]AXK32381.1 DUF2470 domain-containing protein [Streptomyces armeniacus]
MESSVTATLAIPGTEAAAPDPLGSWSPDARAVTADGDVILLLPADAPAARAAAYAQDDDITTVMEITDVAPVSVPHRVRGRAWVAGWLTAVRNEQRAAYARLLAERRPGAPAADVAWMLLRLEVGEAYVDDLWGEEQVEPEDFAAARPDPLAPHEAELLQHLAAAHEGRLRGLCTLLGGEFRQSCGTWDQVTPLALDRYGMRVRFAVAERCFDARFEFPDAVRDVAGLRLAMHQLFEAAAAER